MSSPRQRSWYSTTGRRGSVPRRSLRCQSRPAGKGECPDLSGFFVAPADCSMQSWTLSGRTTTGGEGEEALEVAPVRDRVSTDDGRIIIAGTGRAGTTFLIQLFTALGFGTGFSIEESLT